MFVFLKRLKKNEIALSGWVCPAFANIVDPDQLAPEEVSWSGMYCLPLSNISNIDRVIWLAEN